jgi:ribosomal 50S subunit-recycling heat shock protein
LRNELETRNSKLETSLRLDLFLKVTRLCPRRAVAQQLCDAGLVLLNGRTVKPAHAVKAGDEISVRRQGRESIVRVLKVPVVRNVSRHDANELIEVVSEKQLECQ